MGCWAKRSILLFSAARSSLRLNNDTISRIKSFMKQYRFCSMGVVLLPKDYILYFNHSSPLLHQFTKKNTNTSGYSIHIGTPVVNNKVVDALGRRLRFTVIECWGDWIQVSHTRVPYISGLLVPSTHLYLKIHLPLSKGFNMLIIFFFLFRDIHLCILNTFTKWFEACMQEGLLDTLII